LEQEIINSLHSNPFPFSLYQFISKYSKGKLKKIETYSFDFFYTERKITFLKEAISFPLGIYSIVKKKKNQIKEKDMEVIEKILNKNFQRVLIYDFQKIFTFKNLNKNEIYTHLIIIPHNQTYEEFKQKNYKRRIKRTLKKIEEKFRIEKIIYKIDFEKFINFHRQLAKIKKFKPVRYPLFQFVWNNLKDENKLLLGVFHENKLIGGMISLIKNDHMINLFTGFSKEFSKKGLLTLLIDYSIKECFKRNIKILNLGCDADQGSFFFKQGFGTIIYKYHLWTK